MELEKFLLNDYLNVHSCGYVIEIFNNNSLNEYVFGNKCVKPEVLKTSSDTLYDIASLTKLFTATLVYLAYQDNILNLKDNIYSINNNFTNLKNVTILDLLSHNVEILTRGYLGDATDKDDFYKILYSSYIFKKNPKYVDVHYIILSNLLETLYNKPFNILVKEKILEPLGLTHITFNPNSLECASCNYYYKDDTLITSLEPGTVHDKKARRAQKLGIYTGHAGIFSTGKDLFTFLKSFLNNTLLKKETLDIMLEHSPHNQYNNMSCKYKSNEYIANRGVLKKLSDKSITFSGFTGPMFVMDFNKRIIVLVMCNVLHNTRFDKNTKMNKITEIIKYIVNNISKRISSRGIILKDDKVLTIFRRKKKEDGTFKEYYTIPGGGLEDGESLEENIIREIKEELNVNIKILGYLGREERDKRIDNYFHVEIIDGDLKLSGKEKEKMNNDNYYEIKYVKLEDIKNIDIFGIDMIEKAICKKYISLD